MAAKNSISVLESISKIADAFGREINWAYNDTNRIGDHICYISNLNKFRSHYPNWRIKYSVDDIIEDLIRSHLNLLKKS